MWANVSVYGTWVPLGFNPGEVKFTEEDPIKAVIKITLEVPDEIAKHIQHIDDAVYTDREFLPNKLKDKPFKHNPLVKENKITMVSSLFKAIDEWKEDHETEILPTINPDDDPNGWISDISSKYVYCPNDFCQFFKVIDKTIAPIQSRDIMPDDCIQATIRFAPYAFADNVGGICGVKILMEDAVVVKKLPSVGTFHFPVSLYNN
jgi:hypothetical protein